MQYIYKATSWVLIQGIETGHLTAPLQKNSGTVSLFWQEPLISAAVCILVIIRKDFKESNAKAARI